MGSGFPTNSVSICFTLCISDEYVLSDVNYVFPVMRGAGLRHLIVHIHLHKRCNSTSRSNRRPSYSKNIVNGKLRQSKHSIVHEYS